MSSLTARKTLPDVLLSIEIKLQRLGWIEIHREGCRRLVALQEPRLVFWAVACLEQVGCKQETVTRLLDSQPVSRHWWVLRQLLPDEALYVLDSKLDEFLTLE